MLALLAGEATSHLRIGIDVDDVLAESLPAYLEAFREFFGHSVRIEDAAWEIFRSYPQISEGELAGFFVALEAADFLRSRPVYPEAARGIALLAAAGHRLVVVSGRLTEHLEHTRFLLRGAGILDHFEELIHRDRERAADYKPRIVRERRLEVLIEDELHVARAVAAIPIPVLLFDRPWNQGLLPEGIVRVANWKEILTWVERHEPAPARPLDAATGPALAFEGGETRWPK
jgi:uncharacterized protein